MAGISDKALKTQYVENKYKFNDGSELANKEFSDGNGFEMYETPFRIYDPQLVIFHQTDQLADIMEGWSPYTFALDNPISYNDAWGLDPNGDPEKGVDVKPMEAVAVTAKKKDCTTCDPVTVNAVRPTSSSVSAKGNSSNANLPISLTIGSLGGEATRGVTVVGGVFNLPLLILGGGIYSMYIVSQLNLPPPMPGTFLMVI